MASRPIQRIANLAARAFGAKLVGAKQRRNPMSKLGTLPPVFRPLMPVVRTVSQAGWLGLANDGLLPTLNALLLSSCSQDAWPPLIDATRQVHCRREDRFHSVAFSFAARSDGAVSTMATQLKLGDLTVDVVFKDIKNIHLSVYPPAGRVRISAPSRMSQETIRAFAAAKLPFRTSHAQEVRFQ